MHTIGQRVGVPILAVVKSDAYGLGAERVVKALADLVEGFCVFSLAEAIAARSWESTGKISMTLGPDPGAGAEEYVKHHVRPAVWTVERAAALRVALPIMSVDTGMQRFSCPPGQVDAVLKAGACDEAFTHALHRGRCSNSSNELAAAVCDCTPLPRRCSMNPTLDSTPFGLGWHCTAEPCVSRPHW